MEVKEISKIKLPDGGLYSIKDEEARKGLEYLLGKKSVSEEEMKED